MSQPQLWLLAGGNGAGKSTFFELFLKGRGLPFVNADLIAREYFPDDPERRSREAADMASVLRYRLLAERKSFCFETVFSHSSKIDFLGDAKAAGYEIILVFIHLDNTDLNKARVQQRVDSGGHTVPEVRIEPRIQRLLEHIKKVISLGLADEVHILDNGSYVNPFVRLAQIVKEDLIVYVDPLPEWVSEILNMKAG